MLRKLLGCAAALIGFLNFGHATTLSGAIQVTGATQVNKADIDATVYAAPEGRVSDQQIRMVDAGGHNVGIGVVHRPATNSSSGIVHDKQTEVYQILSGVGEMITGGTLTNPRPMNPMGATVRQLTGPSSFGTGIEGGESRRGVAGDMVIVPAGVPHGFGRIEEAITYLVIRVDPEQVVELK